MTAWRGHWWTIAGRILGERIGPRTAGTQDWSTTIETADVGPVRLSGMLDASADNTALVVLVHGLGGSVDSPYVTTAWHAARQLGLDVLRLNLRGAARDGEDFYHAGLTEDIHATFSDRRLAHYKRLYGLGFSLGGHVLLSAATESIEPRLRAIATVCAPLDLEAAQRHLDGARCVVYRRHVLRGLRQILVPVIERGRFHLGRRTPASITKVRDWDAVTVVPRFGFRDVDDYYRRASVGPRLATLRVPAIVAVAEHDPMVPLATLEPYLTTPPTNVEVVRLGRGGHVGFPARESVEAGLLRRLTAF